MNNTPRTRRTRSPGAVAFSQQFIFVSNSHPSELRSHLDMAFPGYRR